MGLPYPALIQELVPGLTTSCYVIFSRYSWDACSFLKGNEGAAAVGEKESEGGCFPLV